MIVASSMSPTNQTRSDARTGYFDTANARSNFHVVTGHMATRLIVGLPGSLTNQESRRIIGVEVSRCHELHIGPTSSDRISSHLVCRISTEPSLRTKKSSWPLEPFSRLFFYKSPVLVLVKFWKP